MLMTQFYCQALRLRTIFCILVILISYQDLQRERKSEFNREPFKRHSMNTCIVGGGELEKPCTTGACWKDQVFVEIEKNRKRKRIIYKRSRTQYREGKLKKDKLRRLGWYWYNPSPSSKPKSKLIPILKRFDLGPL